MANVDVTRPLLSLRGVKRTYQMGDEIVRALDGIDVDFFPKELVAIIGQSGSGKSTLMNIIGCLDTPSEGSYDFAGVSVQSLDDDELAHIRNREIGFVFQSFNLLPRQSAIDNVSLPLVYAREGRLTVDERRARAKEVLEQVGLGERIHHRPNEMSGGQRQRVAIARALVTRPRLILADEPTGNLDSRTSEEILAILVNLHKTAGTTVMIVTHEPEVADRCDRTVRLKDGRILDDTTKSSTSSTSSTGESGRADIKRKNDATVSS